MRQVIRGRLEALGVEAEVHETSPGLISIRVDGAVAGEVREVVGRPGRLEIFLVAMPPATPAGGPGPETAERTRREREGAGYRGPPEGLRWIPAKEGPDRLVEVPAGGGFTGADLERWASSPLPDRFRGGHIVRLRLRADRAPAFGDFTEKNLERTLAVVIDGRIECAALIQERLAGVCDIVGGGTVGLPEAEARRLAAVLAGGEMPVEIRRDGAP